MNLLRRLWSEESGQGMTEYGLILALIAIVVIVALQLMGGSLEAIFGRITEELEQAPSGS
jgi:pilus assembly protein Flp/PilA